LEQVGTDVGVADAVQRKAFCVESGLMYSW
jgi:hypothetical protein